MRFDGIDLHSTNNYISIIDDEDKVVWHGRIDNRIEDVLHRLSPYKDRIRAATVESTMNWYWLVDGLMEAGYEVSLANPAANIQYSGFKNVNEKNDAKWLAHLLRLDLLKTGYIMPKEWRAVRDLCRKRMQMVGMKTANILSIQNLYSRNMGFRISCRTIMNLERKSVDEDYDNPNLAMAVKANLSLIRELHAQIGIVEKAIL